MQVLSTSYQAFAADGLRPEIPIAMEGEPKNSDFQKNYADASNIQLSILMYASSRPMTHQQHCSQ